MSQVDSAATQQAAIVTCKAANDAPVRKCIMAALLLAISFWTAYDAYIIHKYPYPAAGISDINGFFNWAFNHFLIFILGPLGAWILSRAAALKRQVLVADETSLGYRGKSQVKWADIKRLDATRLNKGLLTIHHGATGQTQEWELDSYFFQNFKELVAFMELRVPPEKIQR